MNADKTDKLIAKAIRALPYRAPSAGFRARVMTAIAVQSAAETWPARVIEAAGLLVGAWAAILIFSAGALIYVNFTDIAALIIQPGGLTHALNLLAAHAAIVLIKSGTVLSIAVELARANFPPLYEIAIASLACAGAVTAVSKGGHTAGQRI